MKLTQVVAMLFIGIVVTSIFLIVNTPNDSNDNINDAPNDYQLPSSLVEVWREDLQYLVQSMKNIHPNLFFHTPETEFDVLVNEIHRNIPTLTEDKIIIELLKLVSRIKDGHTLLFPLQENIGFQIYPLRLYYFDDGLFVVDAQKHHSKNSLD